MAWPLCDQKGHIPCHHQTPPVTMQTRNPPSYLCLQCPPLPPRPHSRMSAVDGVGTLNHATNPSYPDTEPRMSRIKTRTGPSVSGSTVAKTHFSNQNKQMNPLFQKLDRP